MGLPIHRLILATNSNDILARFFNTGRYQRGEVQLSESPSMDIQVASNFERYLFYKLNESGTKVREFIELFQRTGRTQIDYNTRRVDEAFLAGSADDTQTIDTIRSCYEQYAYLIDPHTAVGLNVGRRLHGDDMPLLCLATAHPAKFEGAMAQALPGVEVQHPTLQALKGLPERKEVFEADDDAVKHYLARHGHLQSG